MGLKEPPRGSHRDLCQLLKVLNSFPSAAAGDSWQSSRVLPPSPREEGPRELRSFCLLHNPTPRLGAEPDPDPSQIPAGKMLNANPPAGVGS